MTDFNSTKVQLKQCFTKFRYHATGHFNSTKVQLKLRGRTVVVFMVRYFNSTKVQLKRAIRKSWTLCNSISIPLRYN